MAKEDIVRSRVVVAAIVVWSLLSLVSCTDRGGSARGPGPPPSASVSNDVGAQPSSSSTVLAELGRRELAFVLADGVYVGRADGAGVRRITNIPGFEYQPDWTADGTKLVLRVDDESGRSGGVWSVNADGSDPVDLVKQSGVPGGAPDWSPNGTKIAFVGKRLGERFGIYVMNADGSDPIRLTSQAYEAQYPDWSPDGSRIAFTIVQGGQFDIYVMHADGSGLRQLTRAPGEDNWPEWSPDGSQIVYSHATDLWMMNADGTGQHRLTSLAGEPSWSPDGAWIAFDCAPSSDPDGGVCVIHPDGTGRTPILGRSGSFPAWRP
jgi:Tol biopolymer transport system component